MSFALPTIQSAQTTAALAARVKQLGFSANQTEIVNDATEQTVYTLSIPGGTLSTGNIIKVLVRVSYLNNTGSSQNISFRGKYGASLVVLGTVSSIGTTASRREGTTEIWLAATGTANAQVVSITSNIGGSNANNRTLGTEDSTAAQNLVITVQHNAAALTQSVIIEAITVDLYSNS